MEGAKFIPLESNLFALDFENLRPGSVRECEGELVKGLIFFCLH